MPVQFQIDYLTYSKRIHPLRHGYSTRGGQKPSSLVIHTTNGNRGSSFDAEAKYLQNSPSVSAHFLVGKSGQVVQILPPALAAWHAGDALPAFTNPHSVGIECHHAVGDDYPAAQKQALAWLCRILILEHSIPLEKVETHRKIALPPGRKVDPSDWSDASFYAWRAALATDEATYHVVGLPIYQGQDGTGQVVGRLATGEQVVVDLRYPNGMGHLKDGRGFIDMQGTEVL